MNQKLLIGLGVLLFCIIAAQGVFIYRMSNQVEQLRNETLGSSSSSHPDAANPPLSPDRPDFPFSGRDWNPFEQMQRMQNEMNEIFGDMRSQLHLSPGFGNTKELFRFSPDVDIKEEQDRIVITADIPGSQQSNINVSVQDDQLTISATTKKSKNNNKPDLFRSERFIGQFERSVRLPAAVQADKMKTEYKDGVLTIVIPKA